MRASSLDANRAPPTASTAPRVTAERSSPSALALAPARSPRRPALVVALAAALASAGCPSAQPVEPIERPRVRVRSFTEATPVRHILAVPPFAFAATSAGLDRWDLRSGRGVHLGAEDGLPGERVQALDYDARGEVWIATDAGVVRYDVHDEAFREVPPSPDLAEVDAFEGASVSAAPTGAWIGLRRGLFHVTREGVWSATGVTAPVTDLYLAPRGDVLWVGTSVGLFLSRAGAAIPLGPDVGCDLASVRFVAPAPDGRAVVVGESAAREQRIALASLGGCQSYRASPDETWMAASSRQGELLVLTDRRLYTMRRPSGSRGRVIMRDGMQLLPVPRGDGAPPEASPFALQAMSGPLPAGAQALAALGDEVLVGTQSLGTARVVSGRRALQWLRRGELVGEATALSVACAARDDCYVATGSRRAWRFDGEHFSITGGGDRRVLAVAREGEGRIVGLRQGPDGRGIAVAEVRRGEWRDTGIAVDTPGRDPEVGFARFAPGGILWLGLRYRDDAGELRPYGVALVDLSAGQVAYHRTGDQGGLLERGVLPIPLDVSGVAFAPDGTAWLATPLGAVRVDGDEVHVFGEADGLRSEMLSGVAWSRADGGVLYFAAGGGVGTFDGDTWSYPRELALAVNDMEIGPDQRLWMATDRGLAVHEGGSVRHFDARRGLVENRIEDLAIDQFGRVWLRGRQSLGIVAP